MGIILREKGIRYVEKQLGKIHKLLDNSSADRTQLVQHGRSLASFVIANQEQLEISTKRVRKIGHRGFLLESEIELARQHRFILPRPRVFPISIEPVDEDLSEHIRPSRRWGNSWNAKTVMERWLKIGDTVGVLAGKFRVLNMGEMDALWKTRRKVKRFAVAVASNDLSLVDQEFAQVQYVPPLEDRMQQLVDLRFPDKSRIDYVYHNDADPFFLAGGEMVNFLPFDFLHLPDAQTQSDYLLAQESRMAELSGRVNRLDVWQPLASIHQPDKEQRRMMTNFHWFLTKDSSKLDQLRMQEQIFGLFGGIVGWLRQHKYGNTISSSEIIRRWQLSPPEIMHSHYSREEQLSETDAYYYTRVKALSRARALQN